MINDAKKLNELLKDLNEVKEYFKLKDAIEKDNYLTSLLNTISQTQKEAKDCLKENNMEGYKIKIASLETLKNEFINHTLINNYMYIKDEVSCILHQIVDILSE